MRLDSVTRARCIVTFLCIYVLNKGSIEMPGLSEMYSQAEIIYLEQEGGGGVHRTNIGNFDFGAYCSVTSTVFH
jgi:hypothetical protein